MCDYCNLNRWYSQDTCAHLYQKPYYFLWIITKARTDSNNDDNRQYRIIQAHFISHKLSNVMTVGVQFVYTRTHIEVKMGFQGSCIHMTEWNKLWCKLLKMIIGLSWWSLKKIHHSIFDYLNDKVGLQAYWNLYFS